MKKMKIEMKLVKMARSSGGDRYEGKWDGKDVTIYIPQSIARDDKQWAAKVINVHFEII